jgi:hypothetical protein
MPDEHFDELGHRLSEAAKAGNQDAESTLERMRAFREDPEDDDLDWLSEAAIRWESEHPELARVAVKVINALTAGGF